MGGLEWDTGVAWEWRGGCGGDDGFGGDGSVNVAGGVVLIGVKEGVTPVEPVTATSPSSR